jgi:type I restriction enzyme S subunit
MTTWKTYRLGDLCDTISDTCKGCADEVVLINTSDVLEGKCLNHTKEPNRNLKGQFKKTFKKYDILYSEIRPANKRFAYIDFDATNYIASTKLMVLRHNEKIEPLYLYYILQSQSIIDELQMLAESRSGTFPQITFAELSRLEVKLPNREVQRQILEILGAIDDKIENNRRINTNLELQAQALYKQWFVDNRKEDWEEKQLEEIALHITDGVHNTVIDSPEGEYYLLSCKNIKSGQLLIGSNERRIDRETFAKLRKRTRLSQGDILVTSVGTVGEMYLVNESPTNYEFQRSVAIIKPNQDIISSYFLYAALLYQRNEIKHLAHGAVQQCIFISDLKEYSLIVPNKDDISTFDEVVAPMFNKIGELQKENENLAPLRDTLLPKLMNGEIKIDE